MAFVFYDIETTGISQHFDQILQFAAILTDDELREVERFEIRSRLQPHVVPSPMALHVTGMSIEDILDPGRPSNYEMITAIRKAIGAWGPATFLGYNSLRFDEEFLRHAFYQNLHPPYLTNTGGSRRTDALNIVRAVASLRPGLIAVPETEGGKATFKLDRLAPANGFAHLNAHDALADVAQRSRTCTSHEACFDYRLRPYLDLSHGVHRPPSRTPAVRTDPEGTGTGNSGGRSAGAGSGLIPLELTNYETRRRR